MGKKPHADPPKPAAADPQALLDSTERAKLLAQTYLESVEWILLFSGNGLEWSDDPSEADDDAPGWSPDESAYFDDRLLPSVMRPAWGPMLSWARANPAGDDSPELFAAKHPLACLHGALAEAVDPLETALRKLAAWKAGVPFAWLEQTRIFEGAVAWDESAEREYSLDTLPKPLNVLHCPSRPKIVERVRRESDRFRLALEIVRRSLYGPAVPPDREKSLSSDRPARHSEDFLSVHWHDGVDYTFTKCQAACVSVLWKAWENGTPVLSEQTILAKAGSEGSRLRDVFKGKKGLHPAWDTMIVEAGKGSFRLAGPTATSAPPAKPHENPA